MNEYDKKYDAWKLNGKSLEQEQRTVTLKPLKKTEALANEELFYEMEYEGYAYTYAKLD